VATDVSGTTYQLTSLVPTTSYIASVSAHNNSVFSGPASSVSFTTSGFPVVTGLTVSSIDVNAASVSWNSVGGGYTYKIYRGSTFLDTVSGTTYSLSGLSPTTAYTISVRVTDGTYQGAPASTTFTTATPLTVSASAVTGSGAKISWTSAGSGYTYNLQILQGSTSIHTHNGLTDLSYSVIDLSASTAYIASVRFTSSGFTSSSAYTTTFTTTGPTEFGFYVNGVSNMNVFNQETNPLPNTIEPYAIGYSIDNNTLVDWLGYQFNQITLHLRPNPGSATSNISIKVYDSSGYPFGTILSSSSTILVNAENDYVFSLSSIVTIANPILIVFKCEGIANIQFAVTARGVSPETPFTTMQPKLINFNGSTTIISNYAPSGDATFYCKFSLV
jgi:hypothetical protein